MRMCVLAGATAALGICAWQAWLLHSGPAPFRQDYRLATGDQNVVATRRIALALLGAPSAFGLLLGAMFVGRAVLTPRRAALALALMFFVVGVYGLGVYGSLPYGFGSGYEHASPAQRFHLKLAGTTGSVAFVLGVLSLVVAESMERRDAAPVLRDAGPRAG